MNKKLLIIGFVWPEPKSSAAGIRMLQLIQLFASNGYEITFATSCVKTDNAFNLEAINVQTKIIELNSSSFDSFIKKLQPEVVLFDRFMIEEQYGWRVAEHCPEAIRILDTEDLHCLRKGREKALKDSANFNDEFLYSEIAKREIASIFRSDLSLIISEVEIEILKQKFNIKKEILHYLPFLQTPITPQIEAETHSFKQRQHFITIGNFLHAPNVDAILYLKTTIWPSIRKEMPNTEMHIYGAYQSKKATQLHDKANGFLIKGYVDNVNAVMQNYKVCLVTLRYGAGLKGKIIDAMINGVPCITTSIGAEGMYGDLQPNGFIEDEPMTFIKKTIALYTDETLWVSKQKQGFKIINKRYNKHSFESTFFQKLEQIKSILNKHRANNFIGSMLMHHTLQSTKYMSKWIEAKNN